MPLLTAFAACRCWWGLETRHDTVPFVSAIALFLLGFLGLAISNAALSGTADDHPLGRLRQHPSSQPFLLVGVLILLPIILAYTVFVYYTFRGKLKPGEGYH